MTFQIAFTAPNGILIGSDRKKTSIYGFHHSQIVNKIEVNEKATFAYCSAGDSGFGDLFASIVEEEFSKGTVDFTGIDLIKTQRTLLQCLKTARDRESGFIHTRGLGASFGGNTMLVFRQNNRVALWTVDTFSQIPTASLVIEGDNIKAGDANSPSVFFPHWYFDKVPNTVEALIPIAVHTVLMAEADYIEGIQIGVFTPTVFRVLTDEELKPYIKLSKEIDVGIIDLFRKGERLWSN